MGLTVVGVELDCRSRCLFRSAPVQVEKKVDVALRVMGFHQVRPQLLRSSQCIAPEGVNVYDILRHQTLVLTQAAVASITAALKLEAGAE